MSNLDEQYRQVYAAIQAIAGRCDGARTNDGIGFNGQDTHFGRRIAAMPFEAWTEDIRQEAAKVVRTYRTQALGVTGIDVAELDVVREASEHTNHAAREQARQDERRRENQGRKAERKATLVNGVLSLSWHSKDPDCFGDLLAEVKRLPGRRWTGAVNTVDLTVYALDFIERFGLVANFDVDAERARLAPAEAERLEAAAAPKPVRYDVTLEGDKVRIRFGYDPEKVAAVRSLPGRWYDGADKSNTAEVTQDVVDFAAKFGLTVHPDVLAALAAAPVKDQTEDEMFAAVSRCSDPADLPAAFVERFMREVAA